MKNLAKEFEQAQRLGLGTGKSAVMDLKNSLALEIEKVKQQLANPAVCTTELSCWFELSDSVGWRGHWIAEGEIASARDAIHQATKYALLSVFRDFIHSHV